MKKSLFVLAILIYTLQLSTFSWANNAEKFAARHMIADQDLFYALATNNIANMAALRDQGADANVTLAKVGLNPKDIFNNKLAVFSNNINTSSWPILTWSIYLNNKGATTLLLRAGARVNTPDEYGATALHWTTWTGNYEMARLLLDNGANCEAVDLKGKTAKDWAIMYGQTDLINLIDSRSCRKPVFNDQDKDGVPDSEDLCPNTPYGASVDARGCWVVAYANFFDFDKSVVKKQYISYIKQAAEILKNHPDIKVTLIGYTDSVGSEEYNYKLGLKRAEAVKNILVADGVSPSRLAVSSKGEKDPIASNSSGYGRSQNRRVEIHLAQ